MTRNYFVAIGISFLVMFSLYGVFWLVTWKPQLTEVTSGIWKSHDDEASVTCYIIRENDVARGMSCLPDGMLER